MYEGHFYFSFPIVAVVCAILGCLESIQDSPSSQYVQILNVSSCTYQTYQQVVV